MSGIENYWRGGYTIRGATDVIVEEYGRSQGLAQKAALAAAEIDIERLKSLGIQGEVQVWTEAWRSVTKVTRESRVIVKTVEVERRRDVRELHHERADQNAEPVR
jgi:hypothetical protein